MLLFVNLSSFLCSFCAMLLYVSPVESWDLKVRDLGASLLPFT
jgi:hypothetical protein